MADVLVTITDLSDVASASAEVATVGVALVDPDSVLEIVEGDNITVDDTDPRRPVVSSTGGGAVDSVNGHVGVVVLGASDVGADAAGAAAAAQAASQPVDSDLTAIAALSTTPFGRSLLALADAAAARTAIGAGTSSFDGAYSSLTGKPTLGTAAAQPTTAFDAAGAAAAAQAASQPLDSDLTAIAALTTTTFGRSLLTAADAAATRTLIGAGTSSLALGTSSSTAKAGDYQPTAANISDATTIGRTVLTAADAAAVRTAIGAGTSSLAIGTTGSTAAAGNDRRLSQLPVIDVVRDYGAVVDGSTDDTTAWQNAINAAGTAGGGRIVCSIAGISVIAGALQDTSGANAQLTMPQKNYGTAEAVTIVIEGAFAPSIVPSVTGSTPVATHGTILKSTLASGSGGNVIGGYGPSGSPGNFTNVRLVLKNVTVRTPANWTHSAVDASRVANFGWGGLCVDTGSYDVGGLAMQTTSTSYGVKFPTVNNGASVEGGRLDVIGFYNGVSISEHVNAEQIVLWGCKQPLVTTAGYHASYIRRLGVYHGQHGIVATGGTLRLRVGQFNIEHAASGTWAPVADIDDSSNFLVGDVDYAVVKAGVGIDATFTQNGGTGFDVAPMGTARLRKSNNLSDLASASTARTNLGLGTAAVLNTGTSSGDLPLLSTGGRLPIARVASGTPTGSLFVRDDGTLAAPGGSTIYKGRDRLVASAGNNTLTLGATPVANSPLVWVNNVIKWPTTDYTTVSNVLTFGTPLSASDVVLVAYDTTNSSPSAAALSTVATIYVADNFNRADSASSLGSTSTGSVAWTAVIDTWGISSNQAYKASGSSTGIAVVESGHADGTIAVTIVSALSTSNTGITFRYQDSGNHWVLEGGNGSTQAALYKKTGGGSYTSVATSAGNVHFTNGDILQVILNGSSITVKQNGTTIITATDSALSTATKHGLHESGSPLTPARFDDFSVIA